MLRIRLRTGAFAVGALSLFASVRAQSPTLAVTTTGEIGTPVAVSIAGLPAGPFALLVDAAPGPVVIPGVGTFSVGFSPALVVLLGALPVPGSVAFTFTIPSSPPLVGQTVYLQAAGLDSSGAFHLSNGASFTIDWAPITIAENFDTNAKEDAARTGAFWNDPSGPGVLERGKGGGRGILGDLLVETADVTLDTGNATFPASQTLTNQPVTVTNGIFEFATVRVSAGRKLRFVGANPLRLFLRGRLEVFGILDLKGEDAPNHFGKNDANGPNLTPPVPFPNPVAVIGGLGGAGGPNAGAGGGGGSIDPAVTLTTTAWPPGILEGQSGVGVGSMGGYPNGGGLGGVHYPPNLPPPGSLPGQICPDGFVCTSPQRSSGGGGGGFRTAGSDGALGGVVYFFPCAIYPTIPPPSLFITPGGPAVPTNPGLDPDLGNLKGGSGGSGAGVNPFGSGGLFPPAPCNQNIVPANKVVYETGCGGGGGGGAGQLQAGRVIAVVAGGAIDASGGKGGSSLGSVTAAPGTGKASAGGGGSGGALLLQAGRSIQFPATPQFAVRVKQGLGGTTASGGIPGTGANGGAGGDGFARFETDPAPALGSFNGFVDPFASLTVGTFTPNVGSPANLSGAQSLHFDTNASNPRYLRYELEVAFRDPANPNPNPDPQDPTQTIHVVYDDDPATPDPSPVPGFDPVLLVWQGSSADASGNPIGSPTAWSPSLAALTLTNSRLSRFVLVFDQTLATALDLLAVTDVRIVYKP